MCNVNIFDGPTTSRGNYCELFNVFCSGLFPLHVEILFYNKNSLIFTDYNLIFFFFSPPVNSVMAIQSIASFSVAAEH